MAKKTFVKTEWDSTVPATPTQINRIEQGIADSIDHGNDNEDLINTNAANISDLTTKVETNMANIASNTDDISNLQASVKVNSGNISTLITQLGTDETQIATNKSDIATNKSDIATVKGGDLTITESTQFTVNGVSFKLTITS